MRVLSWDLTKPTKAYLGYFCGTRTKLSMAVCRVVRCNYPRYRFVVTLQNRPLEKSSCSCGIQSLPRARRTSSTSTSTRLIAGALLRVKPEGISNPSTLSTIPCCRVVDERRWCDDGHTPLLAPSTTSSRGRSSSPPRHLSLMCASLFLTLIGHLVCYNNTTTVLLYYYFVCPPINN